MFQGSCDTSPIDSAPGLPENGRQQRVSKPSAPGPMTSSCGLWTYIFDDTEDPHYIGCPSFKLKANMRGQARSKLNVTITTYRIIAKKTGNNTAMQEIEDFSRLYESLEPGNVADKYSGIEHISSYVWNTLRDHIEVYSKDLAPSPDSERRSFTQREATLRGLWNFVQGLNGFILQYCQVPIRPVRPKLRDIRYSPSHDGVFIPAWVRDHDTGKGQESVNEAESPTGSNTDMSSIPPQSL